MAEDPEACVPIMMHGNTSWYVAFTAFPVIFISLCQLPSLYCEECVCVCVCVCIYIYIYIFVSDCAEMV